MELNEIKKDLYKSKAMAKFSHYVKGNLYYTVELNDGKYQFPMATVEKGVTYTVAVTTDGVSNIDDVGTIRLSEDLGETTFSNEIKGSELIRWIGKAVEKGEFIKIG